MTVDIETRLRRDLPALAELLTQLPVVEAGNRVPPENSGGEDMGSAGRPHRLLTAVVVLLVLATGAALSFYAFRSQSTAVTTDVTAPPPEGRGWVELPDPPLDARQDTPSVWTGSEWLVFGGRRGLLALSDGAAYEPSTNSWRRLSEGVPAHPGSVAVWTGEDVVVLAKEGGWIYDVESDDWTDLPLQDPPDDTSVAARAAVWTGDQVVVVGTASRSDAEGMQLAARTLDPSTREWGPVYDAADTLGSWDSQGISGAVWDGSRVQVWTARGEGWAFDPFERSWRQLPGLVVPGADAETTISVAGDGARTYAIAYTGVGGGSATQLAVFEDGAWSLVGSPVPGPPGNSQQQLVVAGKQLVLFASQQVPVAIDPASGLAKPMRSSTIGPGTGRSVAWTGNQLLVFGGENTTERGVNLTAAAAAFRP